jgi:hypothetical protein
MVVRRPASYGKYAWKVRKSGHQVRKAITKTDIIQKMLIKKSCRMKSFLKKTVNLLKEKPE